jgi:methionyl-tRNA formyltransferase
LVVRALAGLEAGELSARPQPEDGVTYAAKLTREEAKLDWSQPAERLERLVRAFTPWPGAWFEAGSEAGGERIRVLRAELAEGEGAPGELLDERLTIACGEGALRLTEVQRAGKAAMAAEAFLRGFAIKAGSRLS